VDSDAAALGWAEKHAHCELFLAQLEGPGVDGLTLGRSLSEIFPGLQIMFLPAYPAAEQRLEIAGWEEIEFAYDFSIRAPETISMPWDEALIEAVVRHKKSKPAENAPPKVEEPSAIEQPPPKKRGFFGALRKS
jgi:CheY-like chemotaxis protein